MKKLNLFFILNFVLFVFIILFASFFKVETFYQLKIINNYSSQLFVVENNKNLIDFQKVFKIKIKEKLFHTKLLKYEIENTFIYLTFKTYFIEAKYADTAYLYDKKINIFQYMIKTIF